MNINLDLNTVVTIATIGASTYAMYKINAKGFELLEEKISKVTEVSKIEMSNMKEDISDAEELITDVKSQLRGEVFPRLNNVEKLIGKNCQALLDHKDECKKTHALK